MTNQHGSTVIEFALISILFLGLLGGIIDLGLGFFHFHALGTSLQQTNRSLALSFSMESLPEECGTGAFPGHCSVLIDCAQTVHRARLASVYGFHVENSSFDVDFLLPADIDNPLSKTILTTRAVVERQCFFCVFFPQGQVVLRSLSETPIPNEGFTCTNF